MAFKLIALKIQQYEMFGPKIVRRESKETYLSGDQQGVKKVCVP